MMKIKYLVIPFGVFLLSGCCASNYSSEMKEVLEPMQKELVSFYTKNQRYPNIDERNILLEKLGCKMTSNNCSYLNNIFSLNSRVNIREEYDLRLKLKNSICFLLLDKNKPSLSCTQESCLGLKQ